MRILIVEDEPLIRDFVEQLFREAGFDIFAVASADEGMEYVKPCPNLCGVFTDVDTKSKFNGLDVASAVSESHPRAVVVISSARKAPSADAMPPNAFFYPKPVVDRDFEKMFEAFQEVC